MTGRVKRRPVGPRLKTVDGRADANDHGAKNPALAGFSGPISSWKVVVVSLAIRLVNSMTIQTFFQPDEYYQCLEPAYDLVFGAGYITWEWREGLRSSLHPMIYAMGYWLATLFGSETAVLKAPKVVGALIACVGEFYLYRFSRRVTGSEFTARLTLVLSIMSPFNWYLSTRSFSNSLEMVLTTIALALWPWDNSLDLKGLAISTVVAVTSCLVRPTNVIIWVYLGFSFVIGHLRRSTNRGQLLWLVGRLVLVAVVVFALATVVDFQFYGRFTVPLYNFVEFNVVKNLSVFYGSAPWHFYIVQGVPLVTMTYFPWYLHSLIGLKHYKSALGQLSILVVAMFSAIAHKEIRFIYPLMPIFMVLVAQSLGKTYKRVPKALFCTLAIVNIAISLYFTRVHERGVIDAIEYLRTSSDVRSFGFLSPCHSTPWQSNINNPNLTANSWFLTCEPPLHLAGSQDILSYKDESDIFYLNPAAFLAQHFPPLEGLNVLILNTRPETSSELAPKYQYHKWPSHIFFFEALEKTMEPIFQGTKFHRCKSFFNSHFHWDDRRRGKLLVYCDSTSSEQLGTNGGL